MEREQATPERKLGFWMVLALVVGTFIGSGIFLLPAQLAPFGWNALYGWSITISGAVCVAFIFAQLARAMPLAAGPYAYVGKAFGPLPAFLVAWSYWISIWVGNAAIATAAVSYLSVFVPPLAATPGLGAATAVLLLWLLTAINCASIRAGGEVQIITVLIKLVPMLVVIAIAAGIVFGGGATATVPYRSEDISLAGVSGAAAITLWALLGFEAASIGARKVKDPERNVPRATIIGTLLVGVIYLLVATPVTMFLPQGAVAASNAPFELFVSHYWSPAAGGLIALFAAISVLGALNGLVLISGEFPLALARNGAFPGWFAQTSARGIAVRGIILSSILSTVLVAANSSRSLGGLFAFMALLGTFGALILYFACAASALRLQMSGFLRRSLPLTVISMIAIVYALWIFYGAGREVNSWGFVLLAAGLLVYLVMKRANRSSREPAAAEAEPPGSSA